MDEKIFKGHIIVNSVMMKLIAFSKKKEKIFSSAKITSC
jgi:hypothetical protein